MMAFLDFLFAVAFVGLLAYVARTVLVIGVIVLGLWACGVFDVIRSTWRRR